MSETWLDQEAGPLVRPYTVTGGRTRPARSDLDMITMVLALTDRPGRTMTPEHGRILAACQLPQSVAEISAAMQLPMGVVKILLSDLFERGLVIAQNPYRNGTTNTALLQTVLEKVGAL